MNKFIWEEIYCNGELKCPFYETTYRAKVHGGWLIRHETMFDFQYETHTEDIAQNTRHIDVEGFQHVNNVMAFFPDQNHQWKIINEND